MNGYRKNKKLTAKEAEKRIRKLETELQILKIETDYLLEHAGLKFDILIKIFSVALKDAATIGEARRWFEAWNNDLMECENPADLNALLSKHGFEFLIDGDTVELFKT